VDLLKANMSIHTIHVVDLSGMSFSESVIPYLETNRFRLPFLHPENSPGCIPCRFWDEPLLRTDAVSGCFYQECVCLSVADYDDHGIQTFIHLLLLPLLQMLLHAPLLLSLLLTLLGLLLQLLPVLLLMSLLYYLAEEQGTGVPRDLLNSCGRGPEYYSRYAKPDTVASPTTLLEERKIDRCR
jgi:hypothetical protein